MFTISDVRHLHLELSSLCNARCPRCARNRYGFPTNLGYEETNLSLETIMKSLSVNFIQQLQAILLCGNFGDFTANIESYEILKYFRDSNPNLKIELGTNGSARNSKFWQDIGSLKTTCKFALDGLEDTHHLYRLDTDWAKIIANAKSFMSAGGIAVWQMIKFEHNAHQIDSCRELSKQLGFRRFELIDRQRDTGPVFARDGEFKYNLGSWSGPTDINLLIKAQEKSTPLPVYNGKTQVDCSIKKGKSVYISSDGKVYPCCYLGFSPETYKSRYFTNINKQIIPLIEKNSLHEYDLETCINWFYKVEKSWDIDSYDSGRLYQCDNVCGKS